jgi:hypothetical protein
MVNVLETRLLEVGRNGGVALLGLHLFWGRSSLVFFIFIVALAFKIAGSFVFMGGTKLENREISCDFATQRKSQLT